VLLVVAKFVAELRKVFTDEANTLAFDPHTADWTHMLEADRLHAV
jgi:hypothetical protein